jgi:hypothetical protein
VLGNQELGNIFAVCGGCDDLHPEIEENFFTSKRPDISAITKVKIKARHKRDSREICSGLEDMAIASESL